jgi:hypothetical protein
MTNVDEIIAIPFKLLGMLTGDSVGVSRPLTPTTKGVGGLQALAGSRQPTSTVIHTATSPPVIPQTAQQRQVRVLPTLPPGGEQASRTRRRGAFRSR